jgi:hypothetical protein
MENEITSAVGNYNLGEPHHPSIHGLANSYIHLATSDNTRKAYRHDFRHYESWDGKLLTL